MTGKKRQLTIQEALEAQEQKTKKHPRWGGARPGAGRKPLPPGEKAKPTTKVVRVPEEYADRVKKFAELLELLEDFRERSANSPKTSPRWEQWRNFDAELHEIGF